MLHCRTALAGPNDASDSGRRLGSALGAVGVETDKPEAVYNVEPASQVQLKTLAQDERVPGIWVSDGPDLRKVDHGHSELHSSRG